MYAAGRKTPVRFMHSLQTVYEIPEKMSMEQKLTKAKLRFYRFCKMIENGGGEGRAVVKFPGLQGKETVL